MLLNEANDRLKKEKITEEQLWGINSLYILLDIDKDLFCKMIDSVGLDNLLQKQPHYDRLLKAEEMLTAKERYDKAIIELQRIEEEKANLQRIVSNYEMDNKNRPASA